MAGKAMAHILQPWEVQERLGSLRRIGGEVVHRPDPRRPLLLTIGLLVCAAGCPAADDTDNRTSAEPALGVIAFSITPPDDGNEIFTINEDGTGLTRITNHEGRDAAPDWSPDAERIAFYAHSVDETSWSIFVMNADGSDIRQLTDRKGVFDNSPVWSPRGCENRGVSREVDGSLLDAGDTWLGGWNAASFSYPRGGSVLGSFESGCWRSATSLYRQRSNVRGPSRVSGSRASNLISPCGNEVSPCPT
jgi:hypothetical protein